MDRQDPAHAGLYEGWAGRQRLPTRGHHRLHPGRLEFILGVWIGLGFGGNDLRTDIEFVAVKSVFSPRPAHLGEQRPNVRRIDPRHRQRAVGRLRAWDACRIEAAESADELGRVFHARIRIDLEGNSLPGTRDLFQVLPEISGDF